MPSKSLERWQGERSRALDQIAGAHALVGGPGPGRRYATEQINHAYTTLLSSQFQGFCRDLHSESVDHIANGLLSSGASPQYYIILQKQLTRERKLDKGNPNPGNLGADFNRLGFDFWTAVKNVDQRNGKRQGLLEQLNEWRNAIAHQGFNSAKLGPTTSLRLATIRKWRSALNPLAEAFDKVLRDYIYSVTSQFPW